MGHRADPRDMVLRVILCYFILFYMLLYDVWVYQVYTRYIYSPHSLYIPLQSFNPVTPSDFFSGRSSASLSFYTCPFYIRLYSPSIYSIDWLASSLSALENNPKQP